MLKAYLISATLISNYFDTEVGYIEQLVMSTDVNVVCNAFVAVKDEFKQQIAQYFNNEDAIGEISDGSFGVYELNDVLDELFAHDEHNLSTTFNLAGYATKQVNNLQLEISAHPIDVFTPSDMTGFIDSVSTPHSTNVCLLKTENPDDGFMYVSSRPAHTKGLCCN